MKPDGLQDWKRSCIYMIGLSGPGLLAGRLLRRLRELAQRECISRSICAGGLNAIERTGRKPTYRYRVSGRERRVLGYAVASGCAFTPVQSSGGGLAGSPVHGERVGGRAKSNRANRRRSRVDLPAVTCAGGISATPRIEGLNFERVRPARQSGVANARIAGRRRRSIHGALECTRLVRRKREANTVYICQNGIRIFACERRRRCRLHRETVARAYGIRISGGVGRVRGNRVISGGESAYGVTRRARRKSRSINRALEGRVRGA